MKLLIIQSHVGGPWRWAIVEGSTVLALSPEPYRKAGAAQNAAVKFCAAVGGLRPELRPSVQLALPFAEVGGGG